MTGEVCGKARKAVTGEEGGGQLHGPAGVVAVTVDHEDQGTRPSDKWGPGASKERPTRWGREVGRGAGDAVERVVLLLCLRRVAPEVSVLPGRLYRVLYRLASHRYGTGGQRDRGRRWKRDTQQRTGRVLFVNLFATWRGELEKNTF